MVHNTPQSSSKQVGFFKVFSNRLNYLILKWYSELINKAQTSNNVHKVQILYPTYSNYNNTNTIHLDIGLWRIMV